LVYVKVASLGQDPISVESDPLAGLSDLFNGDGCFPAFAAGIEVIAFSVPVALEIPGSIGSTF
jgi:hypothetical protein